MDIADTNEVLSGYPNEHESETTIAGRGNGAMILSEKEISAYIFDKFRR